MHRALHVPKQRRRRLRSESSDAEPGDTGKLRCIIYVLENKVGKSAFAHPLALNMY